MRFWAPLTFLIKVDLTQYPKYLKFATNESWSDNYNWINGDQWTGFRITINTPYSQMADTREKTGA